MSQKLTLKLALSKYFGYSTFRPEQERIIKDVISGKDSLVVMPTGAGKSICYQLPALMLEGTAVVVSPLISLMKDQVDAMKQNGIEADFLNSTQNTELEEEVIQKLKDGVLKILYVSPERFSNTATANMLLSVNISLVAVDEAHCISSWGHDFRPEYMQIGEISKRFKAPVIALTATADEVTRTDIKEKLELNQPSESVLSFLRPNIAIEVQQGQNRYEKILEFLDDKKDESGIIYCLSRKGTEDLASKLKKDGIKASYYHAGMSAVKRDKVQNSFTRDNTQVICATIAFGMGIDKSNVRWVIHYNMPQSIENYYQEIGRAGRDGLSAKTLMFNSLSDVMTLKRIIGIEDTSIVKISKLNRMYDYSVGFTCRWRELLAYFGEEMNEDCGNCDICKNPPVRFDGTIIAQKALSALKRAGRPVQKPILVQILRGAQTAVVLRFGYDKIKTYGLGADINNDDWFWYIDQMVSQGLLNIRFDHYNTLQITPAGERVLFKGQSVELVQPAIRDSEIMKKNKKPSVKSSNRTELFDKLRELRKSIADKSDVPAFIIFTDKSLEDMVEKLPITQSEFLDVEGVGQSKLEKYGDEFTGEIIHFLQLKFLAGRQVKSGSQLVTWKYFEAKMTPEEIAIERELSTETIYGHLIDLKDRGLDIDFAPYIDEQDKELILNAVNENSVATLKEIYQVLDEEVPYWKIKIVSGLR